MNVFSTYLHRATVCSALDHLAESFCHLLIMTDPAEVDALVSSWVTREVWMFLPGLVHGKWVVDQRAKRIRDGTETDV
jgi:hypothetical protein